MNKNLIYLAGIIWILMIFSCANPVSPSGGPKDTQPPVFLMSEPHNYSVNFDNDRIIIEFDEFVQLKDANTQILISPPVQEKPEYRQRGKSLIVKFNEPLKENTTYTIFFKNSIVDLNESNPLENFQFVFATGSKIDSLAIRGHVQNAFDLSPSEDVYVMLYTDNNDTLPLDSLPYKVFPYYISQTDANGFFELNNVRDQKYKIFALRDINNNYIYDLPNEEIAFLDSMLTPEYFKPRRDTLMQDSLNSEQLSDTTETSPIEMDSIFSDTTSNTHYDLFLFTEFDSTQKLIESKLVSNRELMFVFKQPLTKDSIRIIEPLSDSVQNSYIRDLSKNKDTLTFWFKDFVSDTLLFAVTDDTLTMDTVELVFDFNDDQEKRNRRKNKEEDVGEEEVKEYIKFTTNASGSFDLNRKVNIESPWPLLQYDFTNFLLVENEDTVSVTPFFTDSVHRKIAIEYPWKEETRYEIIYPDSIFYDLSGKSNDSTFYRFQTKSLGDYGIIKLNIINEAYCDHMIIQLFYKEEKLIREDFISISSEITYDYLIPGDYTIKLICDSNMNGKWDTGDYPTKRQAEKVKFYEKVISIRANWEVEDEWVLRGE